MRYRTLVLPALIASLLLAWAGCDSFLEPDPESFSTTVNFYETPAQFEQAVNAVYVQMRNLVGSQQYRNATDRRGPTLTKHFDVNLPNTVGGHPQTDEWTMTASNINSITLWNLVYDLVKEANVVLSRIQEVEFDDPTLKDRLVGEAEVMRAFAYWLAAQVWGDVPLVTEDARTPGEAIPEGGRAPVQDVYQQVIADLQDAIGKLPVSYSEGQAGRITQGAARFLLGRTYLLVADYQSALEQFEELESSAFPYTLLGDYRTIFDPENKNNAESILEVQYNPDLAGQPHINMLNEILPFNSGPDLLPADIPLFVPQGNIMPTPDVIERCTVPISYACYEAGDLRKDASIGWYVQEGNSQYAEIAWPPRTSTSPAGDSLPYLYKFYWPDQVTSSGETQNNWIIFRFADVLLSAAEAHWRLGASGAAEEYLNRVRARAGLAPVNLADFSGQWTGSPLGDAILHERAQELLGEGHYWLDLKRFGSGVAMDVMQAHAEKFRMRDPKVDEDMYNIEEFRLYYPIPPGDIDLADLTQNPGW